MAVQFLKRLKFQFYTIKSKAERPIKVVIKGLPRNNNLEEIKQDLELLGFTPERVNQLIGRKNKRPLPIFLITLPRNLDNLKIFDLKTLSYLSIRVEGYDGKDVTQCYTCNNFNHSSENCHLNPRCLKCGENHITRDCPIKQKLETPYCINCNIYGHMANYKGCPSFPKPPKGASKNNRNSYTNIYNSLVRPNISYSQVTSGTVNSKNTPQMATRGTGSSAQTETNKPNPPNNRYNNNHFPNFDHRNNNFNFNNMNNSNNFNVQTTLQMTMHCLMQLSQILCNSNNLHTNQQLNPNQIPQSRVFLNFNFKLAEEPPNPRAVSTDWNAFKTNLNKNLSLFDFHPNSINNTNDLEQKITEFTEAVIDTHSHASRPIETDRRNFTPHHINQLLKIKNYFRKRYHQTLNPIFKSHYNRAQSDLKKELKKYNDNIWQKRLEALNTAYNSLWCTQNFFKNKRPKIPPLNCATGTAVTDQQKANLLATNIKNNFVENDREDDNYNQNDDLINTTVNNFLSTP
ncbi:nucleic-acid-binding protein from transposon X-element [Trichonephila clavipes]|nr:nucleic-acid-binding protein from transposon X-element [Trichonephila clavipes]